MGQRGRPRKSIGQHVVDGTYKPCDHDGHGVAASGAPVMPAGFDGHRKWLWELVVENLPSECFGAVDTVSLATACELYESWKQNNDASDHKSFRVGLAAVKQMSDILSKFGWTPSDRARLKTPKSDGSDDDKRFFGVTG